MIHPEKNDSPPPPDPGGSSIDFASLALSGLGLLMLLASLNPHWGLWGIDYLAAFPIWLRVALWCTLLIFSIPHFSKKTAKLLSRAFVSVGERLTALLYFTLAAGLVALFMRFSSQNHLLGDGFIIQSTIAEGMRFSPTEPLEYFVHHLVYTAIGGDKGAYLSYALLSYLMGAVFLLILFRFFKGGPRPFLALAAALSFGAMLFFFGYVENYTISFVMAFVYMLSGWKDYDGEGFSAHHRLPCLGYRFPPERHGLSAFLRGAPLEETRFSEASGFIRGGDCHTRVGRSRVSR